MAWCGMASVNQTWPHCVNQMENTHSKPLTPRHAMCESALRFPRMYVQRNVKPLSGVLVCLVSFLSYACQNMALLKYYCLSFLSHSHLFWWFMFFFINKFQNKPNWNVNITSLEGVLSYDRISCGFSSVTLSKTYFVGRSIPLQHQMFSALHIFSRFSSIISSKITSLLC